MQIGILSRAQAGDIAAFEELVDRHRDDVYGFAVSMTRSETEAVEIAQEAFLSAYLHLNEFPTEAEFRGWVHWTAANHALTKIPPLQSSDSLPDRAVAQHLTLDRAGDTDQQTLGPRLQRAIEETIESLPRRQREVLLLKDVAGLGYEQIAKLTKEPVPNIKINLHQARLTISQRIAENAA